MLQKYPLQKNHELLAHQHAPGSSEGCIHFAQQVRDSTFEPGMASLQCDIADAFSSISRQSVIEALAEYDANVRRAVQG